jgi:hypothetical protein
MASLKKYQFPVCQKVTISGAPLFDHQIIAEAKKGDFWFVKDLEVIPAKMWGIQQEGHSHAKPRIVPAFIASTRKEAIGALMENLSPRITWGDMKKRGFRAVRVVVEVS